MIKPITSLAILAFAFSAFAQSQTVKIKSRGEDIRTVIDSIFEQTGKQYVLETNFRQSLYMNLDGVPFQKAIEIISNVADMEFEEKQGIWYIHKKPITAAHTFVGMPIGTSPTTKPAVKPVVKTSVNKFKAPAKTTETKPAAKKPILKPTTSEADPKPSLKKEMTAGQNFATLETAKAPKSPMVSLSGRLTVQLKKMDIREVFAEFGRQAKVDIELDASVPNYRLDASFYNTTLKFALDKVCKVAGLKYSITPSNTVRITKS